MAPYTYDLFASENIPALILGVAITIGGLAIGLLPLFALGKQDFLAWVALIACAGTGGLVGWGIASDIVTANNNEALLANLIEQTDEVYGIALTEQQAQDLQPPLGTPSLAYEEFGRTNFDFMDSEVPVILVWNEGVLFYAVEGTDSSFPTKEQMEQQNISVTDTNQ